MRSSERNVIFLLRDRSTLPFSTRNAPLNSLNKPDRVRHMIEDQEALVIVQNLIVVSEALIVPHSIKGFQCRNARLQDPLRHVGLDVALLLEAPDVLANETVERLVLLGRFPRFWQSTRMYFTTKVCSRSSPDSGSFFSIASLTDFAKAAKSFSAVLGVNASISGTGAR